MAVSGAILGICYVYRFYNATYIIIELLCRDSDLKLLSAAWKD
jgi:hypothetical protein